MKAGLCHLWQQTHAGLSTHHTTAAAWHRQIGCSAGPRHSVPGLRRQRPLADTYPCVDGLVHSISQHLCCMLLVVLLLRLPLVRDCSHSCCSGHRRHWVDVHCDRWEDCSRGQWEWGGCTGGSRKILISMCRDAPVTTSSCMPGFQMCLQTYRRLSVPCWEPSTATRRDTISVCQSTPHAKYWIIV